MLFLKLTEVGHGVATSLFFCLAAFSVAIGDGRPAHADAYVPDNDSVVLERLGPTSGTVIRELKAMAMEVKAQPHSFPLASRLVRRYIELARTQGDPRFAGFAEAALKPWVEDEKPPAEALFLRATLRQYRHDFDGALDDLDRAVEGRPEYAEALLSRATIHQVRADYGAARQDCDALSGLTHVVIEQVCHAIIASLTGEAQAAYQSLLRTVEANEDGLPADLMSWALQTLGEIAARTGQIARAEMHYRAAMDLDGGNLYLTCALFDLLLDDGRAEEARVVLGDDLRPDLLLLRHAQAARALGDSDFDSLAQTLEQRFAESAIRGDERHLREEARFRLLLEDQADLALDLAQKNWREQRETADARLVLEAALAAGEADAAMPIVDWVRTTALDDAAISPLVAKIEETSP